MTIFMTVPIRYAYPEVNIFCDAFQPFFKPSFHAALPNARFWIYNWPASLSPVAYIQEAFPAAGVFQRRGRRPDLADIQCIPEQKSLDGYGENLQLRLGHAGISSAKTG